MDNLRVGENEKPEDVLARLDREMEVNTWWTPLHRRSSAPSRPRVTEDGLNIPDWWTDDESESQQWLLSQGVMFDE